jgi:hypothetical protein
MRRRACGKEHQAEARDGQRHHRAGIRIESFFPADAATGTVFRQCAASASFRDGEAGHQVGLKSIGCRVDMFLFCSRYALSLLNRGRRRRRSQAEQGAVPDNWHRVGAPGGAGPFAGARAPRDPHPPQSLWVPESWRATGARNAGRGASQTPRRLSALQPLFSRGRESVSPRRRGAGRRAGPGARTQGPG